MLKNKNMISFLPAFILPQEERDQANKIKIYLTNIDEYVSRFRSAVLLFDEAQQRMEAIECNRDALLDDISQAISLCPPDEIAKMRPLFQKRADIMQEFSSAIAVQFHWRFMAARDSALTVYHFGKTFEAIVDALACCPHLLAQVGDLPLNVLADRFPDYASVRHAVAHEAENLKSGRHGIDGPHVGNGIRIAAGAQNIFISGALEGRTHIVTVAGKKTSASLYSIEIGAGTFSSLQAVRDDVFSRFALGVTKMRAGYLAKLSAELPD